jgi:hypothetical protein
MDYLIEVHKKFLQSLIEFEVDFIVAGGYAVIYHGYVRTTSDMDIWLKPDNNNRKRLVQLLIKKNFSEEAIELVSSLDFTSPVAFHFGRPPEKMDFFTAMVGLDFDTSIKNALLLEVEKIRIPFLSLEDLVTNKMMTTRGRDHVDVEILQKVKHFKKKKS